MNYLLIEPSFPIPNKSINHKDFLPIGLLKIVAMLELQGHRVELKRGNLSKEFFLKLNFIPDEIWITSLFTYWIHYVKESVMHYREIFPNSKIVVGGIAASLFGKNKTIELTKCDDVITGIIDDAEKVPTNKMKEVYDRFVPEIDFQILHSQRGCFRKCSFCGTWKIEQEEIYLDTVRDMIFKRNIVFYDNNFLVNPHVHNILDELIELKQQRKILWCESQSGFDGRLLEKDPILAYKLKKAGFRNVRIAWDWGYEQKDRIKKQIDLLIEAGYKSKEISVFMLYNWDISFDEMEKKRTECYKWQVQIADCRYRPLNQEYDYYNPRKLGQNSNEYYIHENWTDILVKQFRRNVRRHNICVRHQFPIYAKELERKSQPLQIRKKLYSLKNKNEKIKLLRQYGISTWDPSIPMTRQEVESYLKLTGKLQLLY